MTNATSTIRRWAWVTLAVVLLGLAVFQAIRPQPHLVDMHTVEQGELRVTIDEDGVTRIRERYLVSAPLTGRLLRIQFDVGNAVIAGETVVARMEPTNPSLLDPRVVAQTKARVNAAQRKKSAAETELTKAENALDFAEMEMERARHLRERDVGSKLEFERKELLFRERTEDARAAGFAVEIAAYELELHQAALLLTDPDNTDDAEMELEIKAPIDGRILRVHQESSAVVSAGSPLLEIGDPADLEVVVDVLSRDAVRITPGCPVVMEQWGGDDPLEGRVRLVEPSGFTKLSALGVEEQRVNVIVDFLDPPAERSQLGDNFRVDCRIVVWRSDAALRVPVSALFRVDSAWHVFRNDGGFARLTPIQIGQSNGRFAEVLQGLPAGELVVVHPGDLIEDNTPLATR